MSQYVVRRLLLVIPTLFLVSVIVFSIVRFIPGDVVNLMLEQYQYGKDAAELRHKLGLDRPVHLQYIQWLADIFRGNFGISLWTKRTGMEELGYRFPVTLQLSFMAIVFSILISIPIGILAAIRQNSAADYIARSFAIGALSIPAFWLATLLLVLPSIWFKWTPPLQEFTPFLENPAANLGQFTLPAILLGLSQSGTILRMTRAMMLEVLHQDYIRTAWAKGLRERVVVTRHALKNAMIPVISIIGVQMPFYFGGTVIMEYIFRLPGMGSFTLEVISRRDYPMIQAVVLFIAALIVIINLVEDLAYGYFDPRIRYG